MLVVITAKIAAKKSCQIWSTPRSYAVMIFEKSKKPSKKFLLCDWLSSAGYEAPAVIFVSDAEGLGSNADQRYLCHLLPKSKGKIGYLGIYSAPNLYDSICDNFASCGGERQEYKETCKECQKKKKMITKIWSVKKTKKWSTKKAKKSASPAPTHQSRTDLDI